MKWHFYSILLLLSLTACGGGGGGGSSDFSSTPEGETENENTVYMVFEGKTLILSTTLEADSIEWQQLSGPTVLINDSSLSDIELTAPWLSDGSAPAEFEVIALINGESISEQITVNILDRRFIVLRAENEPTSTINAYLDYISANDEEGVPEEGTIQLTALSENTQIGFTRVSPSGQYVAFSVREVSESLIPVYRGIYIVDIETLETQKLNVLGLDSQDVQISTLEWSPDSLKLLYEGDHGEGYDQYYVVDITDVTTVYSNYGNNTLASGLWPSSNLYPVGDGGNPYNLDLIVNTQATWASWSGNSNSVNFLVYDSAEGDDYLHQSSIRGDARQLERAVFFRDQLNELDQEALDNYQSALDDCMPDNPCAALPFLASFIPVRRYFTNIQQRRSSVEGHLAFMANVILNNDQSISVLAVRDPVIDNTPVDMITLIEAEDVDDAAWSPVAAHLAFTSTSDRRHRHTDDTNQLYGSEIPDQLYLYYNYEEDHSQSQERLAYPQPTIDSNPVRKISWSDDGNYIAYARGEENVEGAYYTSLWVTLIDDVRDESPATVAANTTLLINLNNPDEYMTDFLWSPNGDGVLILVETDTGPQMRYINRETQATSFVANVDYENLAPIFNTGLKFSPNGDFIAYLSEAMLYVWSVADQNSMMVNVPLGAGGNVSGFFRWSPHGDTIIYSARVESGDEIEFYQADTDGNNQTLDEFFQFNEIITSFIVK